MKKAIFLIIASVMLSTLSASTQSFRKSELAVDYVNIISNVDIDTAKSSADFDFRVGFVESLMEIQNKDQKSNSFFDTVAIWVSYRF